MEGINNVQKNVHADPIVHIYDEMSFIQKRHNGSTQ